MMYYKKYDLDASEFAQYLCGFEPILKNEEKIYMVYPKGALTARTNKLPILTNLEQMAN